MVTEIEPDLMKLYPPHPKDTVGASKENALRLVPTVALTVIAALTPNPLTVLWGEEQTTVL
jgi:hypothetical protein